MGGKREIEFGNRVNSESLIRSATISIFSLIDIGTSFFQEKITKGF